MKVTTFHELVTSQNDKTYAVLLQISLYNAMLISSFECLTKSFKMLIISSD